MSRLNIRHTTFIYLCQSMSRFCYFYGPPCTAPIMFRDGSKAAGAGVITHPPQSTAEASAPTQSGGLSVNLTSPAEPGASVSTTRQNFSRRHKMGYTVSRNNFLSEVFMWVRDCRRDMRIILGGDDYCVVDP